MARFGAVVTAMVTPFDADGALDLDGAARLARWLVDHGNDALVVAGTTGESAVLTDDERVELFRAVRAAVDVPLIAGSTTNDTAHSVEMTRAATAVGMDAVLAVVPYYNKPPQSGLELHFRAVAEVTHLPVMLYDVPGRTGRALALDTAVRLATEVDNIVALKDAGGDPARAAALLAEAPEGFEIYSGDEPLNLAFAASGAVGVVGVSSHWTGALQGEMFAAFAAGEVAKAQEINRRLLASFAYMNTDTCVFSQAVPVGACRLPLGPAPAGTDVAARQVLTQIGYDL
jgi:4-hydroxy-tetrahydrodipicolinate synthase